MKNTHRLFVVVLLGVMLAACGTSTPGTTASQPAGDVSAHGEWQGITFDFPASLGKQWIGRTNPGDQVNSDMPATWLVAAHEEISFPGYPVSNKYMSAEILVFAVSDWRTFNPEAEKRIAALTQLLKDKPTTFGAQESIPVLPVFNAAQVFRAHVTYVSFKNGSGVRFITQYDQAPIPINNSELIYTFQALTTDGNYYVAAFFPINFASLPADASNAGAVIGADFVTYLDRTVKTLESAAEENFNVALGTLDKVLESLKVK